MNFLKTILLTVWVSFLFVTGVRGQDNALSYGTIIIMLTSNDTIWVGADSRTSALTDTGYSVNKKGMCKIYSTNDVVYAMAGHVRYVDNSFDFIRMMQGSIDEEKDFKQSMQHFQQRAKNEILSILKRFSRKSINTLIQTNNGSFLTVVAISFVNGEKQMKELRFSIQAGKDKNTWTVACTERSDNGVGTLRFFGHATNALAFVRDNNLYFGNGRDIPNKINDLIKLESVKGTTTVGMPADVISIYNGGYKRVITSGLCQETL